MVRVGEVDVSARKVRMNSGAELSDLNDRSALVGMFDNHAAHLYDYCLSLLGDEAEAASASTVTLIAAYMLGGRMNEPGQLRAWMLALARRECLSDSPTRREPWAKSARRRRLGQPVNGDSDTLADAVTSELEKIEIEIQPLMTGFESEMRRAVRLVPRTLPPRTPRPDPYREVLDLVHRHGISPAELPAILDISAEEAQDLLAAAPVMTSLTTARAATARRRDPAGPLASMPGSVWRETASVVFDTEQSSYCQAVAADAGRLWAEGFPLEPSATKPPSQRKMAMTSVGLAAALLAPAALGAALYAVFAASPHSVTRSHEYAIVPPATTRPTATPGTATHSAGRPAQTHAKRKNPITSIFSTNPASAPVVPQPTTQTSHRSTSSPPVIHSSPPTITPTSPGSGSSTSTSPSPTSPSTSLASGGATSGPAEPSSLPSDPSPSG
jgi:DNA-directed RNA polymerase specialized sigma24 family protein